MDDLRIAERAVGRLMTRALGQYEFDALVSFTFNLGVGALQRSTLRRVINRRDTGDISSQWLRWVWGGGRKLPGLIRRRHEELALFFSGN
jgi:lysozyme